MWRKNRNKNYPDMDQERSVLIVNNLISFISSSSLENEIILNTVKDKLIEIQLEIYEDDQAQRNLLQSAINFINSQINEIDSKYD